MELKVTNSEVPRNAQWEEALPHLGLVEQGKTWCYQGWKEPKSWKCHNLAGTIIMGGHDYSQCCEHPHPSSYPLIFFPPVG